MTMTNTLSGRPHSVPLAPDHGPQQNVKQEPGNDDHGGIAFQVPSSSHSASASSGLASHNGLTNSTFIPASDLPTSTNAETGLVGLDLNSVSDQLEFPDIPQALLDKAPEYEYSAHTRANIFSDAQLTGYSSLNQFDEYGLPVIPTTSDDSAWNVSAMAQFGGYDELGNYQAHNALPSSTAADHPLELSRSLIDTTAEDVAKFGEGNFARVTPPSAEYANVSAPWMPVSFPASNGSSFYYSDPSSSTSSTAKEPYNGHEPPTKRRRPSPGGSTLGSIDVPEVADYPHGSAGTAFHTASSSPAGGTYVRSQPPMETPNTSAMYSHTGHRPPPPTQPDGLRAAVGLLPPDHTPHDRSTHWGWSHESDTSRAPLGRLPPGDDHAIQTHRAPGPSGYYGSSGQAGPSFVGGYNSRFPPNEGPSVLMPPNGNGSNGHHAFGHERVGNELGNSHRSRVGRDSLSQSSDDDAFDAPPPNPKAVALAAAATRGASGTQQQADMLSELNETLSTALETDGVARCPFPNCTKTFAKNRSYNLKTHLRAHSQLKPFACASCPRAFSRKHDLERHSRVHSGDKPYICEVCGRGFPRSDALRRHWRVEKECGDRASEIDAGQPLPSLPPGAAGLTASAQVPSQTPMTRFIGPNAYPIGWAGGPESHHRMQGGMPGGGMSNMPVHMGIKRARNGW